MTKIVMFDILGPGYHYDGEQGFDHREGALPKLLDLIKEHGYEERAVNADVEADIEEEMLRKRETSATITPGFVETVLATHEANAIPVITSAGTYGAFDLFLEKAVAEYNAANPDRPRVTARDLFPDENRYSTVRVASKKRPETWNGILQELQKRYGRDVEVEVTYEDTLRNMYAAIQGTGCRGFHVVSQPSGLVTEVVPEQLVDPKQFRGTDQWFGFLKDRLTDKGTMTELLPKLQEVLRGE